MLTSGRIEDIRQAALTAAAMDPLDEPSLGRDTLDLIGHIWGQDAEIERLTKPDTHTCLTCVHWGTSMSAYPCLECGQHYDRSDLWEPAEEARDE